MAFQFELKPDSSKIRGSIGFLLRKKFIINLDSIRYDEAVLNGI